MTHLAAYGIGQGLEGRNAAIQAAQKALDQLGALRPALALAFVAEEFDIADATAGLVALLGDTPLWGVSTIRPLAGENELPRSVVVVMLTGNDLKAQVQWWPTFSADSQETTRQVVRALRSDLVLPQAVLLAADGVNGNLTPLCSGLADLPSPVAGCLASGRYTSGKTELFAKGQSGSGALITAALGGRFSMAAAFGHGWHETGLHVRLSRTRDVWIQAIDDAPPVDFYSRYFGHSAREWAFPPLNELVRLYPFGIQPYPGSPDVLLRSPLRVEVDGSLRMSAPIPAGATAHLMLGDPASCLASVEETARQAMRDLGSSHALVALAFVDLAWLQLFGVTASQIPGAIQEALGSVPVVGAYTLGQILRPAPSAAPEIFNQGIQIVLLGYQG